MHDRYWESRGIQVVRPGRAQSLTPHAASYLLVETDALLLFDEPSNSPSADILYVHLHDAAAPSSGERVVTDAAGRFVRFERAYHRPRSTSARAAFTRSPQLAAVWQVSGTWKSLRRAIPKSRRRSIELSGQQFTGRSDRQAAAFVRELMRRWNNPSATIGRARPVLDGVWGDPDSAVHPEARLIGPVWLGRGRRADPGTMLIGPTVLWDDPHSSFSGSAEGTRLIPPTKTPTRPIPTNLLPNQPFYRLSKRLFDIVFSLIALALTLPFYPFIILAIVLTDGMPIFFRHRRETLGGHEFKCLKFRSMRRDAEATKSSLIRENQADGPQFYIRRDPRLTPVGRLLRRLHVDEWPQFFNVLAGHMSIVGPRPSPFKENQFCPTWRAMRLSVRPGVTGLWQIKRTRRHGADFQEWIRYDIEYVENASWATDLRILWSTVATMLFR